ncbi:MAG: FkbM family methyltransferase [Opitutaceae bacterium]|jgi:FkbM family methyltransferase
MMTNLLKSALRSFGVIAVRRSNFAAKYLAHPPRCPFDEVLLRAFPSPDGLSFVQIGANDGCRNDPIRKYVSACKWRGVAVEPDPKYFQELCKTYEGCPDVRLLNAAVDTAEGERNLYYLRTDLVPLPDWASGTGSLDLARVQSVAKDLSLPAEAIASRRVKTVTWDSVWAALGAETCDVLVLDTEGHDVVLLRAADLARRRPRVVHFEHSCLAMAERLAFYGELLDAGYELSTSMADTTACLPPASGP